jgi:integrase
MAQRLSNRLTDLKARKIIKNGAPVRVPDGDGLYLEVHRNGTPSWVFRYAISKLNAQGERIGSRERWAGLGAYPDVGLAEARDAADGMRRLLRAGHDPIEYRRRQKAEQQEAERLAATDAVTFRQVAESFIASHRAGWKNAKHAAQWPSTLKRFAYPIFGDTPIKDIDTEAVLKVLRPIWLTVPETATRTRQRIEAVLDSATAQGLRRGDNPARWKGHLSTLLPRREKIRRVKHHPAMPHADVPEFWPELNKQTATSAKSIAFLLLTAARTSEVRFACWREIDFDARIWTVPASRMKAERDHVVPLSDSATDILRTIKPKDAKPDDLIFPGRRGRPQSENTLLKFLKEDLKHPTLTVHGFRSSFRDWVGEETSFPDELAEMALAHVIRSSTKAAYRRKTAIDRRRVLMTAWADFVTSGSASGKVVRMKRRVKS